MKTFDGLYAELTERAATVVGPTGAGTVSALLHDELGHTARCAQALIVRSRSS